jgi:hypothetical protein
MIKQTLAGVLLLISTSSSIADPAIWKNEVTSLRSVAIGAAITQFPECPKKHDPVLGNVEYSGYETDYPAEFKDKPCFKTTDEIPLLRHAPTYVISNLPFIKGGGREVVVTLIEGRIEEIGFDFLNQYDNAFLQALKEKYGEPSKKEVNSYQNGFGQTFQGISARWFGKTVTLWYDQYTTRKDWGRVGMYSKRFSAALMRQNADTKDSISNGL